MMVVVVSFVVLFSMMSGSFFFNLNTYISETISICMDLLL